MLNMNDVTLLELDTWSSGQWRGLGLVRIKPWLYRQARGAGWHQPRIVYRDDSGPYIINEGTRLRFDDETKAFLEQEYGSFIREERAL